MKTRTSQTYAQNAIFNRIAIIERQTNSEKFQFHSDEGGYYDVGHHDYQDYSDNYKDYTDYADGSYLDHPDE